MTVKVLYTTRAQAIGGRDGQAATMDHAFSVKLATPREMGGAGGPGNNPEQLFAAGYAACFLSAIRFVAGQSGQNVPQDANVTATVGIGPRSGGGFGIDVALEVALPGMARSEAQTLVTQADKVCPYSNALRNNVPVRVGVISS
jgi:Ohr subfamily peroxiredoxin